MILVTNAIIWLTILATAVFIVLYLFWQGWPRAAESKQLLSLAFIDAAVFTIAEINSIFGRGTVPQVIGIIVFAGMPITRIWLLSLLIKYRRRNDGDRRDERV